MDSAVFQSAKGHCLGDRAPWKRVVLTPAGEQERGVRMACPGACWRRVRKERVLLLNLCVYGEKQGGLEEWGRTQPRLRARGNSNLKRIRGKCGRDQTEKKHYQTGDGWRGVQEKERNNRNQEKLMISELSLERGNIKLRKLFNGLNEEGLGFPRPSLTGAFSESKGFAPGLEDMSLFTYIRIW